MNRLFQRKILHILTGGILISAFLIQPRLGSLISLAGILLMTLVWLLPFMRRSMLTLLLAPLTLIERMVQSLARDDEPLPGWGVLTLILAILAAFTILPKEDALLVSIYVALGDGISSMLHGLLREKRLASSLLGMLPAFALSTLLSLHHWLLLLLAFLLASLAEASTRQAWWDDDLSVSGSLILLFLTAQLLRIP